MKYNEDEVLNMIRAYIESTYSQHYNTNGHQLIDDIIGVKNDEESLGFLRFTIARYISRYGKKDGYNMKDLLKAAHYLILLISHELKVRK